MRFADVFVAIDDPRKTVKVRHDLLEALGAAVNAVLVVLDTLAEIELWARDKPDWLRSYPRLQMVLPSVTPLEGSSDWSTRRSSRPPSGVG